MKSVWDRDDVLIYAFIAFGVVVLILSLIVLALSLLVPFGH